LSSFSELTETYKQFAVPAIAVKVSGASGSPRDITNTAGITSLSLDLSTGSTASACRFDMTNVYTHKNSKVEPYVKLGEIVRVSVGYGSVLKPLFTGYIDNISYSLNDGGQSISVSCLDARGLMKGNCSVIQAKDKKIAEVLGEMLDKYAPLVGSKSLDLDDIAEDAELLLDKNDLAIITKFAESRKAIFLMQNDKATIHKNTSEVCVSFDWSAGISACDVAMSFLEKKLKAKVRDAQNPDTSITLDVSVEQPGTQESPLQTPIEHTFKSKEKEETSANLYLEALASQQKRGTQSGTITCIGLPELEPGKMLSINSFPLESITNRTEYYISAVNHSLSDSGFTTTVQFDLGV